MADELDLIAVGGGLAGLTAANRSLELGRRALVLEKQTLPRHLLPGRGPRVLDSRLRQSRVVRVDDAPAEKVKLRRRKPRRNNRFKRKA